MRFVVMLVTLALTLPLYGIPRFFRDYLRATDLPFSDVRYFGLTPAQYAAVAVTGLGCYLWVHIVQDQTP